jgi:mannitol/fructose-specific phosphotransferase system IIA component (Ntr-type)
MAIAIADLLDPRQVRLRLRSRTAENAIQELVTALNGRDGVADPTKLERDVVGREREQPSIVESEVVFPHARTDAVEKIVLAIGIKPAGIPFGLAGERAKVIFLIGVPRRLVNDYLVAVGGLARVTRRDTVRQRLLRAGSPEEFIEQLRGALTSETI